MTDARSSTPLRLLTPRNHGHGAWVYQSSHGGGFVGADDVALEVEVAAGATLFLSTQAASRVYRAATARACLRAEVGPGATLISWPDPVCCFPGASFTQAQHFALAPSANLLAVDAWSAGRVSRGERWGFEALRSRLTVDVEGRRLFHDAVELSSRHGALPTRMADTDAFATVVVAGPDHRQLASAVEAAVRERAANASEALVVVSPWPWGAVVRIAARSNEALALALRALFQGHVAGALGDDPLARKW